MSDQDLRYTVTAEDRFSRVFQQLKRDVGDTQARFGGLIDRVSGLNVALGSIALGAAGGLGAAAGIKQLAHDIDALNDSADATGSTVENLSALEHVARLNGASLEVVTGATMRLNKVLSEAKPDSPTAQALARIGLDAAELRKQDPAIAVQKVAQALAEYRDDGDKARLVQELFGKSTKEVAAFLKDLAEAGQLNATVTSEQAKQAERFNKQLSLLSTNASDAARGLTVGVVSAVNQLFDAIEGRGVGSSSPIHQAIVVPLQAASVLGANVAFVFKGVGTEIGGMLAQVSAAARGDFGGAATIGQLMKKDAAAARAEFDALERRLMSIGRVTQEAGYQDPWVRNRMGDQKTVGPMAAPPAAKAGLSEYDRYLERLTKEAEGYDQLTTQQKLLMDLQSGRLTVANAGQRTLLMRLAEEADFAKAMNGWVKERADAERKVNEQLVEREQHMQRLMDGFDQKGLDAAMRLMEQTPTGRLQALEQQAGQLKDFAGRIGADDPRQKQVLEAMQALKKQAQEIASPAEQAKTEYEKLADAVEKSMDRSTGALLDFIVAGEGSVQDLGRAFSRDVLRALIEDPVRDTMKAVAKDIAAMFRGDAAGGPLGDFLSLFKGSGGDFLSSFGGAFGFTGRAGGGSVSAGDLVRWQENGREWFVPSTDGTVVTEAQMRSRGAGASLQQHNTIIIQGGDPAQTQRQIDAALARNNAALERSMRYGALSKA